MHFLLTFLFICTVISCATGTLETIDKAVCEYEDALLAWAMTHFADAVTAKVWYKGHNPIANWLKDNGFEEFDPYKGRLKHIGESDIKISEANRSDSGNYSRQVRIKSGQVLISETIILQVLVPPSALCFPTITQEGDTLTAMLPEEGCGIPRLTPSWTSGTQKLISDRISVLDLKLGSKLEVYNACAVGISKSCNHEYPSSLCTNITGPQPQHENNTYKLWLILVLIFLIIIIIIICIGGPILYRKRRIKQQSNLACKYKQQLVGQADPDMNPEVSSSNGWHWIRTLFFKFTGFAVLAAHEVSDL